MQPIRKATASMDLKTYTMTHKPKMGYTKRQKLHKQRQHARKLEKSEMPTREQFFNNLKKVTRKIQ